jgi:site-specific recombinase XerD
MPATPTLARAFERFLEQSNLSPGTLRTYAYAVRHFYAFLEGSRTAQPLSLAGAEPAACSIRRLGSAPEDVNLLAWFVSYLGHEVRNANPKRTKRAARERRLEPSTVRLYGQAVLTWFAFLADELLLPDAFPAAAAIARAQRQLRTYVPLSQARDSAPEPPDGLEDLIHAFDTPAISADLPLKERHRRKLEALRNRALLYALADSGARISEILRLTADDVAGARLNRQGIWAVEVRGKGRGRYGRQVTLRFTRPTLSAMREYLKARSDPGATGLFVSHAQTRPKSRGQPLSPNAAWRIVQSAAVSLGLSHIHPHDFRHWRATQMLREGVALDQVQRFLNHRSIRTTQLYAKTAERQVDEAGARTSPVDRG